jgi:hypothetical protein
MRSIREKPRLSRLPAQEGKVLEGWIVFVGSRLAESHIFGPWVAQRTRFTDLA